jgi:hypothetical protein
MLVRHDGTIKQRAKVFTLVVDVEHEQIPPLLRSIRYQTYGDAVGLAKLVQAAKQQVESRQ